MSSLACLYALIECVVDPSRMTAAITVARLCISLPANGDVSAWHDLNQLCMSLFP